MARSKNRLKFTKSSIEKLVPPARTANGAPCYETWIDTERRGLALRLSSEGRVSFFLATARDGRSQRINLGRFSRTTVEQVRARAREYDAEIVATGRNPNPQRRERRESISLGELFERYRADWPDCARQAERQRGREAHRAARRGACVRGKPAAVHRRIRH